MRHLFNKRSGRNLCEVKNPKVNKNVSDRGLVLGQPEIVCPTCGQWYGEYAERVQSQFNHWANTKSVES